MPPEIEITTLEEKPHLLPQLLDLLEESLEYSPPHCFATDFHPLVRKSNHRNLHLLLEDKTLAAHIGLLPKNLIFGERHFPVALIGGVATAKAKRGRGYFHRLMVKVLENPSPYMGHFLWGELESLYKKYGFHQMGILREQKSHSLSPLAGYTRTLYKKLSPALKRQLQNIHSLNTQNFITLQRDWSGIEKITSCRLYIKQDHKGELTNYFFVGKGRDLTNIVHEAFGLPDHPNDLAGLTCWMPDIPQYRHLPPLYGCLFKIGSPHLFQAFIAHYSGENLAITQIQPDLVTLAFGTKTLRLQPEDFLTGLFGPNSYEEFKPFYTPLWFGGLDSV